MRGSFLADGYYNEPEKTAAVFTQNPLNTAFPERIYRTGDLARLNKKGKLYISAAKIFRSNGWDTGSSLERSKPPPAPLKK